MQPTDDLQLIQMMIEAIVGLSDEHHAARGESVDEAVEIERCFSTGVNHGSAPLDVGRVERTGRLRTGGVNPTR